jgi:hypothetical protein
MTRTDVHSPKNLVTEDYEYVYAVDNQLPGKWVAMMETEEGRAFQRSLMNFAPETSDRGIYMCHHCGRRIRYAAFMRHVPTGKMIVIGEQCLGNRFELATADFHRLRKAAELDRKAQRIKKAKIAFVEDNPDLAWLNDDELPDVVAWNDFVWNVKGKFQRYGELSQKQADAIRRIYEGSVRQQEKRREEKAQEHWIPVPVTDERIEITGVILSTKWVDNDFGGNLKMLFKVETEAGNYKLWSTVPNKLSDYENGQRLTLKLRVERSRDDEFFGFGKRPSLVKVHSDEA